jgi:hypothetical protein
VCWPYSLLSCLAPRVEAFGALLRDFAQRTKMTLISILKELSPVLSFCRILSGLTGCT